MKKVFFTVLITFSLFLSCNNEETENIAVSTILPQVKSETAHTKPFVYDGIYEIRDGKEIDLTYTQNFKRSTSNYEFYEITTIQPSFIYTGSVITAESINGDRYIPAGYANDLKEKVTISFSLPDVKSKEISPKKSSFTDAIHEALGTKDFSGKQSQVISYKMKGFTYYNEVKLAFGANVNVAGLFNFNTQINSGKTELKTGLFIDFSQVYFNVAMDIPDDGNIYKDETIRQKYLSKNPVYISSVNYGRKGIMVVESNYSYEELSIAIRASFNAPVINGSLSLDSNSKKILEEARIKIYILGGDGDSAAKTVAGFKEFQDYIVKGGVYSKEIHGVPISFSGSYASDNSMFISQFSINY